MPSLQVIPRRVDPKRQALAAGIQGAGNALAGGLMNVAGFQQQQKQQTKEDDRYIEQQKMRLLELAGKNPALIGPLIEMTRNSTFGQNLSDEFYASLEGAAQGALQAQTKGKLGYADKQAMDIAREDLAEAKIAIDTLLKERPTEGETEEYQDWNLRYERAKNIMDQAQQKYIMMSRRAGGTLTNGMIPSRTANRLSIEQGMAPRQQYDQPIGPELPPQQQQGSAPLETGMRMTSQQPVISNTQATQMATSAGATGQAQPQTDEDVLLSISKRKKQMDPAEKQAQQVFINVQRDKTIAPLAKEIKAMREKGMSYTQILQALQEIDQKHGSNLYQLAVNSKPFSE
jgi:hypothetical protein